MKETNKSVLLSAEIMIKVEITKCTVLSLTTTNKLPKSLFFILGGPAISFATPSYFLSPDCKFVLLFRDANDNFDL